MGQKVWDLHFVDNGVAETITIGAKGGVVYHIFDSKSAAEEYANQYRRARVIQNREWHESFLDSPFVHDHRAKDITLSR